MATMQRVRVTPPEPERRPFGILDEITWLNDTYDRWTFEGIDYRPTPTAGTNALDVFDTSNPNETKDAQALPTTVVERDPETCYLRVKASTGEFSQAELAAIVQKAFDLQTGTQVEAAAYAGFASTDSDLLTTGAQNTWPSLIGAVAQLEAVWTEEQGDIRPTLHIPFFAYPYFERCASGLFATVGGQLRTVGGTKVILGGGYTNMKDDLTTDMPAGTVSIHMTGDVFGLRSGILRPVDPSASIHPETNTLDMIAEASYVVGWNSPKSYAAYGAICA